MSSLPDLLRLGRPRIALRLVLLDVRLEGRYLLVDAGNVLLDHECEFLGTKQRGVSAGPAGGRSYGGTHADFHWSIVEERFPFGHWTD